MTLKRASYLVWLPWVASACASGGGLPPVPPAAEIPRLEADLAADPGDVPTGLRLVAGYREAGRTGEARSLVDRLLKVEPDAPGLLLMSGIVAEDEGAWAEARVSYDRALDAGVSGEVRDEVERRLEVVRREELRARVASALAREDEVAQTAPDPATVGVFPFLYEGDDPNWEPLALAIPEMLTTDLAVTGRLQVLERLHVQALLDEMALGASGRVDEATAARSGRLLGSGNIVQGRFRIDDDARIGIDAAVVEVREPGLEAVDPLSAEDAVERLFDLEKQLALDLHEELGVQLTPAERERISERQTESVQALLEFGRGLQAEDAGDFQTAQEHYSAAASIDPGFQLAQTRLRVASRLMGSGLVDVAGRFSDLARRFASQRHAVRMLRDAPAGVRDRVMRQLGEARRSVLAEVLGQDRVGQTVLLELIFRGPGGEE